jgi:hypothetical protein
MEEEDWADWCEGDVVDRLEEKTTIDKKSTGNCNEAGARRKAGMNYKLYSCSCTRECLHKQILNILL